MRVLQLTADYLNRPFYRILFGKLEALGVELQIYTPVNRKRKDVSQRNDQVFIDPCFSTADRALFYTKQRSMYRSLRGWADFSKIDVMHAHTLFSAGYAAWKLHQETGTPYIVAVRSTDVNVFFKYMVHLRHVGVQILKDAYRVVFLSPAYRDFVIERYIPSEIQADIRGKSLVIPNGIHDFFLQNRPEPRTRLSEPVTVMYAGEINSNKNLELTVQAVKLLRQQGREVTLTAVGEIQAEKYQKLIDETPFLTYFPRCPREGVLEHLRQSDIFVMPSHTETFGLVYAEAMSQGLPVLYTRGQGFDRQFPDGTVGYAVSDTDPAELAEKLQRVMAEYPRLSENCIANVSRFDWGIIAEEYQNIYRDACSAHRM